jgi:hypothetical protein
MNVPPSANISWILRALFPVGRSAEHIKDQRYWALRERSVLKRPDSPADTAL